MEHNEVSFHEVRVYLAYKSATGWLTAREVAAKSGVAERTARAHSLKLVKLGVLDQAEVFPAHRYRIAGKAAKRNAGYLRRLENACAVFGETTA
jgi:hypothetical protein